MQFKDVVTDPAQFRELMGEPPPPCVAKTITIMDRHCRAFIARSPFVLIASANAQGMMDISPKGDATGFVLVLDDKTLAVPDRPGNRRADTFTNVLENPRVGLIFFVPGKSETLRISGSAKIVRDADLRSRWRLAARHLTSHWFSRSKKHSFTARNALSVRTCGHQRLGRRSMASQVLLRQWWMQPRCRCRLKPCKKSSSRTRQNVSIRVVRLPSATPLEVSDAGSRTSSAA